MNEGIIYLIGSFLFILVILFSYDSSSYAKYKVTAPGFGYRKINHYTIDKNKCLRFVKNDKNYTFCGTYEIIENY